MEEFNTCLKRSRFGEKIKDFTLISNARHQNIEGKIVILFTYRRRCMLRDQTIFVQNQLLCLQARLSDWPTYLYHYICLFLSAFFGKYKLFETLSLDHSQSILRPSIM